MERLRKTLQQIDGRGYKAYKDIAGSYQFNGFQLSVDHVQGDPFAAPSRVSVQVPMAQAGFADELYRSRSRQTALEDFIGRAVARAIRRTCQGNRGLGHSGQVRIATSGQQILRRNAVLVSADQVEARLTVGLPARGRQIAGRDAAAMLLEEIPEIVRTGIHYAALDSEQVRRHVASAEDQDTLRNWLAEAGLIAFVADGAVLPRRSGVDDRPLSGDVITCQAPPSLARTVTLPNAGEVRGMGIPAGVTLVVGGGFHGKSTLLHALERGVYNHIPGDGREQVATDPSAVKIRSEDGRAVRDVDIRAFIDNLPFGRDTSHFSTENASGSTSQAANIVEAAECNASTLLIDEDTSATNFMIRDQRMQQLVAKDKEPITPLLSRIRELYTQHGISTVIVMGGSGDYFGVSDTVVMMDAYSPQDVTAEAHALAGAGCPQATPAPSLGTPAPHRRPPAAYLDPSRGKKAVKIDVKGPGLLLYGHQEVDLSRVEQLVDRGQTEALGLLIHDYARRYHATAPTLVEGLRRTLADAETHGLDSIAPFKVGHLALPRLHEVAAALNRFRSP